ncbi:MAG: PhzF family phenazine biosynthesis protein [Acidimicrobiia bacterium]|nr:PhzF family phenazine biosynthesis protein [Acidimicrobiia bacterium]
MRHCYVVRVFTVGSSGGNALGVIPDSVGLDSPDMQRVAAELGFSETVFIDWPGGEMPALRIFTPATELPFAGHPLVGTAWVLNQMGPGVEAMSIQIGEVGVRMEEDLVWVTPPAVERPIHEVAPQTAIDLGVPATVRAWRVEVPSDFLVAEVSSEADLLATSPDMAAVAAAADGLYVFHGFGLTRSRFFAPRLGVEEDPATGSAAVALCAVSRALGQESGTAQIVQGLPGALSEIQATWDGLDVALGGTVVKDEVRELPD